MSTKVFHNAKDEDLATKLLDVEFQIENIEHYAKLNEDSYLQGEKTFVGFRHKIHKLKQDLNRISETIKNKTGEQRNIPVRVVIDKLCRYALSEAKKENINICFASSAFGSLGIKEAEVIFSVAMPTTKILVDSIDSNFQDPNGFFSTLIFEVRVFDDCVVMKISDDKTSPVSSNANSMLGLKNLRAAVAKNSGCLSITRNTIAGRSIEIKIPAKNKSTFSRILTSGTQSFAISEFNLNSVNKLDEDVDLKFSQNFSYVNGMDGPVPLCLIGQNGGILFASEAEVRSLLGQDYYLASIITADVEIAVLVDKYPEKVKSRIFELSDEWVSEDSWFFEAVVVSKNGQNCVLPMLSGRAILNYSKQMKERQ